jgi:predicted alpha/beta superfamily hydrolase
MTDDSAGPVTLPGTASYRLAARYIDQTFQIDVAAPSKSDAKLPVIYVLDGGMSFAMVAQIVGMLRLDTAGKPLPPIIVVGIGYPAETDSNRRNQSLRLRDLTPTHDAWYVDMARKAPGPFTLPPDIEPGGGPAFLKFIQEDVNPFIEARYPVDTSDQTLVGMSLGGLFTLSALFHAPEKFRRYVALSPSLWWDSGTMFKTEEAYAGRAKDLAVDLYLSIGGLEELMDIRGRMVSNVYRLESLLRHRKYPGLKLSTDVFPEETHMSVFPASVTRGLRSVFHLRGDQ